VGEPAIENKKATGIYHPSKNVGLSFLFEITKMTEFTMSWSDPKTNAGVSPYMIYTMQKVDSLEAVSRCAYCEEKLPILHECPSEECSLTRFKFNLYMQLDHDKPTIVYGYYRIDLSNGASWTTDRIRLCDRKCASIWLNTVVMPKEDFVLT
jgi:hypothetical protein